METTTATTTTVPARSLADNNYRTTYDMAHVSALAADIAAHGLQTPPMVRPSGPMTWHVVFGHTRILAMMELGWADIPVQFAPADWSEADCFDAQIRENELRREVPKADRAKAMLIARDVHGRSIDQVAEIFNVSAGVVRNWLRCAESLTDNALADWSACLLSDMQAYALCRVGKDRQRPVLELCRGERFSVKAFDELVSRIVAGQNEDAQTGMFDMADFALQVQDMAAEAKSAAKDAKRSAKEAAASAESARTEVDVLRKLLMQARAALQSGDAELGARFITNGLARSGMLGE